MFIFASGKGSYTKKCINFWPINGWPADPTNGTRGR